MISEFAEAVAEKKIDGTFGEIFTKGIGANWLVCLAIYLTKTANSPLDKMVTLWFPIATFVALGMEHSVANMYLIPFGMMSGADVDFGEFIGINMVPTVLGNILGGAGMVATAQWLAIMPWNAMKQVS
jgi:formate/nitrite transporter